MPNTTSITVANGLSSRSRTATQTIAGGGQQAGDEQGDEVVHPRQVQRVVAEDGQPDVPAEAAQHQTGGRAALRRAVTCRSSSSGIHDPWKPDGTPRGSVTAATGRARHVGGVEHEQLRRAAVAPGRDREQPAVVLGAVGRGGRARTPPRPPRCRRRAACSVTAPVGDVELHHGGRADGVAVAGVAADALVVDGGELDGPVGQRVSVTVPVAGSSTQRYIRAAPLAAAAAACPAALGPRPSHIATASAGA